MHCRIDSIVFDNNYTNNNGNLYWHMTSRPNLTLFWLIIFLYIYIYIVAGSLLNLYTQNNVIFK